MNKTAVISGGTKGIGRALVEKFAAMGFDVFTCARHEEDLQNLREELAKSHEKSTIFIRQADLSVKEEAMGFADFVKENTDRVDVLLNNTGVFIPGAISSEEDGALEMMIETNLYSAYHLTRGILPLIRASEKGHIFNICSVASIMPYADGGSYSISKYAMLGMTKVLREEMKTQGIRVTAVLPGATLTTSWEGTDLPGERFMKAEDVAGAVYGAYALSKHSVVEEIIIRPQLGDI